MLVNLEVCLETIVADKLLPDLLDLVLMNCLRAQVGYHLLDTRLDFGDLRPHNRHALHLHVLSKVLVKLSLEMFDHLDLLRNAWIDKTQNATFVLCNELTILFVPIVSLHHVKVDHSVNFFDNWS